MTSLAPARLPGLLATLRGPHVCTEPPDGGIGWLVAVSAFLVYFICVGPQYLIGVLYRSLIVDVAFTAGWSRSDLAWLTSLESATFLCGQLLAGYAQRRWGARRVVLAGGVLMVAGFLASAAAPSPAALFLSYSLLTGLGCALPAAGSLLGLRSTTVAAPCTSACRSVSCGRR